MAVKLPGVSERRACRVIGQHRSVQRYKSKREDLDQLLTEKIIELESRYGRYGYRRITALLRRDGFYVNHKRVQRIWRQQGLKVPLKQPKRGRLWLNDGSCIRHKPESLKDMFGHMILSTTILMMEDHTGC